MIKDKEPDDIDFEEESEERIILLAKIKAIYAHNKDILDMLEDLRLMRQNTNKANDNNTTIEETSTHHVITGYKHSLHCSMSSKKPQKVQHHYGERNATHKASHAHTHTHSHHISTQDDNDSEEEEKAFSIDDFLKTEIISDSISNIFSTWRFQNTGQNKLQSIELSSSYSRSHSQNFTMKKVYFSLRKYGDVARVNEELMRYASSTQIPIISTRSLQIILNNLEVTQCAVGELHGLTFSLEEDLRKKQEIQECMNQITNGFRRLSKLMTNNDDKEKEEGDRNDSSSAYLYLKASGITTIESSIKAYHKNNKLETGKKHHHDNKMDMKISSIQNNNNDMKPRFNDLDSIYLTKSLIGGPSSESSVINDTLTSSSSSSSFTKFCSLETVFIPQDNKQYVIGGNTKGAICIWEVNKQDSIHTRVNMNSNTASLPDYTFLDGHNDDVRAMVTFQKSNVNEDTDRDMILRYDISRNKKEKTKAKDHTTYLCTSGADNKILLWNLSSLLTTNTSTTGETLEEGTTTMQLAPKSYYTVLTNKYSQHKNGINSLCIFKLSGNTNNDNDDDGSNEQHYSPTFLASGGSVDGLIHLWNLETLCLIHTLRGHHCFGNGDIFDMKVIYDYSTGDPFLLSASKDETLKLWNVDCQNIMNRSNDNNNKDNDENNRLISTMIGHRGPVKALIVFDLSPPSQQQQQSMRTKNTQRIIASGGLDQTIRLWSVNKMLNHHYVLENEEAYNNNNNNSNHHHYLRYGNSSSQFGCIETLTGRLGPLCSLAVIELNNTNNANSSLHLVSASAAGSVQIWEIKMMMLHNNNNNAYHHHHNEEEQDISLDVHMVKTIRYFGGLMNSLKAFEIIVVRRSDREEEEGEHGKAYYEKKGCLAICDNSGEIELWLE